MRIVPGRPVRPRGDVMRTEKVSSWASRRAPSPGYTTPAARLHTNKRRDAVTIWLRVGWLSFPIVDEVTRTRRLQDLGRQLCRLSEVLGQRNCLVDQIARLAATELDLPRTVVFNEQAFDDVRAILEALLTAAV